MVMLGDWGVRGANAPKPKPKKKKGPKTVQVAPSGPSAPIRKTTTPSGVPAGGGGGGGGSRAGGGGRSQQAQYDASIRRAEARADAKEKEAKRKASDKYRDQAKNLENQAKALRRALNKDYKKALRIKIGNVNRDMAIQDRTLRQGYRQRANDLRGLAQDNEAAEAGQSNINRLNASRERNSAVSEAMLQGAGESDLLRSQMMSLRNWNANQTDVNRSFFDGLRSINNSLGDLNVDTKTARVNTHLEGLADKEQLWTNFYNQRGESLTQLGNIRGQQADYFAMAKEMTGAGGGGKKGAKRLHKKSNAAAQAAANRASQQAFLNASKMAGKAWKNPGLPKALRQWKGRDDFQGAINASRLQNAETVELSKRPEGATLRSW